MTLETERLILRPWREEDAASLYEYARDPLVGPAAGWAPHTGVENSREIIRTVLSAPDTFAVTRKGDPDAPIGSVGIFPTECGAGKGESEIGYWLARPYWGQGLIPKAVRKLLRLCFLERGEQRVWCARFAGNEKSKRVIEKCGFSYVCTGEESLWPDGSRHAGLYYAITKEEWEAL